MRFLLITIRSVTIIFALIGFVLIVVYIGVNLHLTNTSGIVDSQTVDFWSGSTKMTADVVYAFNKDKNGFFSKENYCLLEVLKEKYPAEFRRILNMALNNKNDTAVRNLSSVSNVLGVGGGSTYYKYKINTCKKGIYLVDVSVQDFKKLGNMVDAESPYDWANSKEWEFFKRGVIKDTDLIHKIEKETGIKGRIIVSQLVAEQMRVFYSDRPFFKAAIAPSKVLASMSQFSWGILGVKQNTARAIEHNLKDTSSVFYLGKSFENTLDFKTKNKNIERFKRITKSKNHYYAYMYDALYNKQIIAQWKKEGFDISNKPAILATLYNIGFANSHPKYNPEAGGAALKINGQIYSFGGLAFQFYYSGELLDAFPQ